MQRLFTKILVPVFFDRNTYWSVGKSIQLANKFNCDIVLLYVNVPFDRGLFSRKLFLNQVDKFRKKLQELEHDGKQKINEGAVIQSVCITGSWQQAIKDITISEHIDLVVLPTLLRPLSSGIIDQVNINRLVQESACPVLTLNGDFDVNQLHDIVVSVCQPLPVRKLALATYLSLETKSGIHLVSTSGNSNRKPEDDLAKAYQLLNDVGKLKVQCAIRTGLNGTEAVFEYAKNVNAGLVMIDAASETGFGTWWNRWKSSLFARQTRIPVLTVNH